MLKTVRHGIIVGHRMDIWHTETESTNIQQITTDKYKERYIEAQTSVQFIHTTVSPPLSEQHVVSHAERHAPTHLTHSTPCRDEA